MHAETQERNVNHLHTFTSLFCSSDMTAHSMPRDCLFSGRHISKILDGINKLISPEIFFS